MIRADNTPIILGEETNFQDGAIGHSDPGAPLTIGARVTIGHQAILHGCTVSDDCLIGMGARVLNGAFLGPECLVGANALITEGKRFEEGGLIVGVPGAADPAADRCREGRASTVRRSLCRQGRSLRCRAEGTSMTLEAVSGLATFLA